MYRDFGNSTWPSQSNDLETQVKIDVGSPLRFSEYETASVAQTEASNILFWSNKLVYPLVAIVALVR